MSKHRRKVPSLRMIRHAFIIAAVAATGTVRALGATDVPTFQPGYWSFTINYITPGSSIPHVQSVRRCANPTDDIRKKWQALAVETCKFSPIERHGNRYSYTSSCRKEGMQLDLKAVILVESDSAYRVESESRSSNQVRKETLIAKREGDCPSPSGHLPLPQPRKDLPAGS